jgi:hypothetical protein
MDVSISCLLFWMALHSFFSVSQYTYDVIAVPCCMSSTISNPFLSQQTAANSFLAGTQRMFKLFQHLLLIRCDLRNSSPPWWYRSNQVRAKAILCNLGAPVSIFRIHLVQNLWWQPSLTVIISYRTVHKICGNSHENSETVKHHLPLWTRSCTTDGWPLRSSSWTSVCPSLNILHHCLTVPSLITFWP